MMGDEKLMMRAMAMISHLNDGPRFIGTTNNVEMYDIEEVADTMRDAARVIADLGGRISTMSAIIDIQNGKIRDANGGGEKS